ncbi:class I SAM-dependent methyltransferase [Candidatus Gottesmanbacteria bacterium]|nr:class I SAM-dependent methyltransferase [Candidatus Gottesmanbacteria bacterium]
MNEVQITHTALEDVQLDLVVNPIFLERLKPHSRDNIRRFVSNCAAKWNLEKPFVDVACGYRTNQPEVVRSHNGIVDLLYIAFDHTLNFERPPEPNASPNLVADATNIPLPDASVGTVLCTEVLEHVPDDQAVVAEISRILKRGGD